GFPPAMPGFEILVIIFLGIILGGAGLYLGFFAAPPERDLAAILLAGGGAVLAVAAAARGLPESAGWIDGVSSRLAQALGELARTGGIARWSGLGVLFGAYRFARYFRYDPAQW